MSNRLTWLGSERRRRDAAMVLCLLVTAGGCSLRSGLVIDAPDYDPTLLSGERIFSEPVTRDELPVLAVNEPSEAMRAYVAARVPETPNHTRRFRYLFKNLHEDGYFDAVYSANQTLTAAEAFEAQGGNCLSYTNMFVALARAAGLQAHYQIVDTPANWDADSGFLIRYTHINVLLENVQMGARAGEDLIIDFNDVHPEQDHPRQIVSDAYAESLFYANHSVRLLREGSHRQSFAWLRRALDIAPENVDLWINLGAFYATTGDPQSSIEAYHVALQLDSRNKSAYSGLARSHRALGNEALAGDYEQRVRHYRERNPYYHYALAQAAYETADYPGALESINSAIDLRYRTARFHLLKGLVEQQLGDLESADDSFRRAERYGLDRRVKIDLLRSLAGVTS